MPGDFSGALDGFMGLLKGIKKEEISEVFSKVGTDGLWCRSAFFLKFFFKKEEKSKELSEASDDNQKPWISGLQIHLARGGPSHAHSGLSEEHEGVRFAQIGRKKDFVHIERVNGKTTNVLHGLELHTGVFNAEEQKEIVDCVFAAQGAEWSA
ncbi:hypothetical protein RHMOL_Rhmol05G0152300 [Rhododendron molle]|uniref:Uncharacterized protein n=1 Tax=Rhododendron molle TaxID=49168 RepID=A0ACC0NQW7_RHOML|nr:hypothetical protein RHMOL_Rhmol05G0152300 [Rhododendron molle]